MFTISKITPISLITQNETVEIITNHWKTISSMTITY